MQIIRSKHLYVGVPRDNQFLTMVACVQEYGAHIQAKNYPYLWIPTSNAKGRKASEIPNLYVRGHAAGYDDQGSSFGFCVCFVLKKSVNIPARPFLRLTNENNIRLWSDLATQKAYQAAMGQINIDDYFNIVGKRIENDIKDKITQLMNPSNAPLTVERKGKNDPLMDTGKLRDSITYTVI